ncbi:g1945 [Coccomyxa elongata]
MWYDEVVLSKGVIAAALVFLSCLTALPPNTLKAGVDKRADKYVRPGSLGGLKICTVLVLFCAAIVGLDSFVGAKRLQKRCNQYEVAYALMAFAGGFLRLWAMATLKRHFTFEVGIVKDHKLVQNGPYRIIRHPGYTGGILSFLGTFSFLGLQPFTLLWWLLLAIPMSVFMVLRIRNEEETLHRHFGKEWEQHCKRTWRLFPPIF